MPKAVPNETDWGDYQHCADMKRAYGLFYSRTAHDIPEVMLENPLSWIECMHFMPGKVFDYYLLGFCKAVSSSTEPFWLEDDVVAASFLFLINERMQSISKANRQTVLDTCGHFARHAVSQTPDEVAETTMFSADTHALSKQIDDLYQEIFSKHQYTIHNQTTN